MKVVLFILSIFLIISILYGLYSGLHSVARALAWFNIRDSSTTSSGRTNTKTGAAVNIEQVHVPPAPPGASEETSTTTQKYLNELKTLFELHQCGALTKEEFEKLKNQLLTNKKI